MFQRGALVSKRATFRQVLFSHFHDTPEQQTQFYLICGGLIDSQPQSEWVYEPDVTPLPDTITKQIRAALKKAKRQLRRNTTTGRYPTIDAITQLFNYLFSGHKTGTRRASQALLHQMGFPSNNKRRLQIINVLIDAGLLHKGPYRSKSKFRRWNLDISAIRLLNEERQKKQETA